PVAAAAAVDGAGDAPLVVELEVVCPGAPSEVGDAREGRHAVDATGTGAGQGPGVVEVGADQRVAAGAASDGRTRPLGGRQDVSLRAIAAALEPVHAAAAVESGRGVQVAGERVVARRADDRVDVGDARGAGGGARRQVDGNAGGVVRVVQGGDACAAVDR